jgi:hypothetical protein
MKEPHHTNDLARWGSDAHGALGHIPASARERAHRGKVPRRKKEPADQETGGARGANGKRTLPVRGRLTIPSAPMRVSAAVIGVALLLLSILAARRLTHVWEKAIRD